MQTSLLMLNFSGKIIDYLGIQMYQSPIAAIAEMVSNSWMPTQKPLLGENIDSDDNLID